MLKIIQIAGKATVGKDTFANELYKELNLQGKKVCILHYGDRIKDVARILYGWNGLKDEAGRHLLQQLGTEKGRAIDKNLWVKEIHTLIKFAENDYDFVLLPDCRFINEIEYWDNETNYENLVVKLERLNYESTLTTSAQSHTSETALDNYENIKEFTISGKLEELNSYCKLFIKKYNLI